MTSSPMTSLNWCQKMCSQTRNSCAKAFGNRSRSKNLKPKKLRGVNLTPPPSRLLGLSSHCFIIHLPGGGHCLLLGDSEPIRLLEIPTSPSLYMLITYIELIKITKSSELIKFRVIPTRAANRILLTATTSTTFSLVLIYLANQKEMIISKQGPKNGQFLDRSKF